MVDSLATTRNHGEPSDARPEGSTSGWRALWARRKRLAPLVVVVAIVAVALELERAAPREVSLRFDLGVDHERITEARIVYSSEGEVVHGVRFGYPDGAPETVAHQVELAPGRYRIEAALRGPAVDRHVETAMRVPVDGTVRVDLSREASSR